MIIDDDVYLEHYGKKGMHWGVRTAQKQLNSPAGKSGHNLGKKIKKLTPEQKQHIKKVAIGVGVAAGISATAIVAGRAFAKTHIKPVPLKSIPRTSPQHDKFIADFMKKQFRLNAAANGDLKNLYTMNDTPIHMREYLPILPGQKWGRE